MAKPPSLKRITYEDLAGLEPGVRKGLSRILNALNPFISGTSSALDNRLTLSENMACVIKKFEFTMPETGVELELTPYGTSEYEYSGTSYGTPRVYRTGDDVVFNCTLRHRATNILGYTQPIFKVPKGFRPITVAALCPAVHNFSWAVVEVNRSPGEGYLVSSGNGDASGKIDLYGVQYKTNEDPPSFAAPFPLTFDVSSLGAKPLHCFVAKVEDLTDRTAQVVTPNMSWTTDNTTGKTLVKIDRLEGLATGHKYAVTVVAAL